MQFDSPDALMRAVAGQTDRVVGRMNGQQFLAKAYLQMRCGKCRRLGYLLGGRCHNKIMANHLASHQANRAALFRQAPA